MLIEQAIFTSAATDRAQGYQLIRCSPGLCEADARELARWGPSHDSLLEGTDEPASTNFHRLASGAYAISRTTVAGAEYSGRGASVYTQFLVVPPEVLARFANNPFEVLRAATASGALRVYEEIPESLEPLRLSGRARAVDASLLAQLACRPGPAAMATLVQAALSSDQLAVASTTRADTLFAGLINLVPVECRTEFSFTTGLKFSPRRPFRISALPSDAASWRAIGRHGVTLLNLDGGESTDEPRWESWAGCVAEILESGRISLFATQFDLQRPSLTCANLEAFAEEIQALLHPTAPAAAVPNSERPLVAKAAVEADATTPAIDSNPSGHRSGAVRRHFDNSAVAVSSGVLTRAADELVETLAAQPPKVLEMLERLDDLVFAAIGGDRQALVELGTCWPSVIADLDPNVIEQSREQYLRCALSIWSECVDAHTNDPKRAVSAIDVLCVLFEE